MPTPPQITVKDKDGQPVVINTPGDPINGEILEIGGTGAQGWLSSIRLVLKAIRDRLPTSLVGGRLDVAVGNFPATQAVSHAAGTQADGHSATLGAIGDSEAPSGNGSLIALTKRLRSLLGGGLPAALGGAGGLKVEIIAGGGGGNVQYAEGATQATPTGNVHLWRRSSDNQLLAVSDVTGNALPVRQAALAIGTDAVAVFGQAGHGSAINGNPVRLAGRARNASITALANDQTADLITDLFGRLVVTPYAIAENLIKGTTGNIVNTTDTQVIAAQAAGVRLYITHISIHNSHATTGTWVNIKDGSTTIFTAWMDPKSGGVYSFAEPLRGSAATALNAACETSGANVRVNAVGHIGG